MGKLYRQTNFAAGELAPGLWGRMDLPAFQAGARRMRNMFPTREGKAVSRPGTVKIAESALGQRLVPFIVSEAEGDRNFVLEFGGYATPDREGAYELSYSDAFEEGSFVVGQPITHNLVASPGILLSHTDLGAGTGVIRVIPHATSDRWAASGDGIISQQTEEGGFATASVYASPGPGYIRVHTAEGPLLAWDGSIVLVYGSMNALGGTGLGFEVGSTILGMTSGFVGVVVENNYFPGSNGGLLTILPADPDVDLWLTGSGEDIYDGDLDVDAQILNRFESERQEAVEFETPFSILEGMQYVQSGDVLTVTVPHTVPGGGAWNIRRVAAHDWRIEELDTTPEPIVSLGVGWCRLTNVADLPIPDDAHPAREWRWKITEVRYNAAGIAQESDSFEVVEHQDASPYDPSATLIALYEDFSGVTLHLDYMPGADPAVIAFKIYRGRGDLFGYVGETTSDSFVDVGEEPDYSRPPPRGTNPLWVRDEDGAPVSILNAQSVGYFQERLVLGGSSAHPQRFWASGTGRYANFDEAEPAFVTVASPVEYELASRRREQLHSICSLDRMLFFTSAAVWAVSGANGEPLSFESVDAQVIDEVGAALVAPAVVDGCALYVRNKGTGVRAIVPGGERGYTPINLSGYAAHLFAGKNYESVPKTSEAPYPRVSGGFLRRRIVDWCYAEDPWGLVWAVRDDGLLLSLCFDRQGQQWGWSWHDTGDGDRVKAICAIPYRNEDVVFLLVERGESTYLERMVSRVRDGGHEDDLCVDSAVPYEGPPTTTIENLEHLEGREVWAVSRGNPIRGPMTVEDGAVELSTMPTPYSSQTSGEVLVHVGLRYLPQLESLDALQPGREKNVTRVEVEVEETLGLEVGESFDGLTAWQQRTVEHGLDLLEPETGVATLVPASSWNRHGRVCIQQSLPAPLTVLGIVREVDFGD